MVWKYVQYERDGHVAVIRLNRPERMNSMSMDMMRDFKEALERLRSDDDARVGIFTGTGNAFCSGLDLKQAREARTNKTPESVAQASASLDTMPKPMIAAVNGYALGGGMGLAMRCDLRVAAESAVFGMPELERGMLGVWTFQILHTLPDCIAKEIAYGFRVTARRAFEMGLVNRVTPDHQLMDTAMEMANHVASMPPLALKATRQMMISYGASVPETAMRRHLGINRTLEISEDALESTQAWLEKRKPVYHGR